MSASLRGDIRTDGVRCQGAAIALFFPLTHVDTIATVTLYLPEPLRTYGGGEAELSIAAGAGENGRGGGGGRRAGGSCHPGEGNRAAARPPNNFFYNKKGRGLAGRPTGGERGAGGRGPRAREHLVD